MRALLAFLALALAACGDAATKPEATPPPTGPLVTYERAGGFASQPQRLVVERDGSARLTVQTGQKVTHASFTVPADRLDELEQALDDAQGVDVPKSQTACADCFTYAVDANGVEFSFDDVSLEDAPAEARRVVGVLQHITD
jgi:hypothetical protein